MIQILATFQTGLTISSKIFFIKSSSAFNQSGSLKQTNGMTLLSKIHDI